MDAGLDSHEEDRPLVLKQRLRRRKDFNLILIVAESGGICCKTAGDSW